MYSGFKDQCVPQYRLLNEAQIKRLHTATLDLLETNGVKVMDDEALEMLSDAGCRVSSDQMVTIPNWLVEESIRSAPSRISIYNRLGKEAIRLENNRIHFGLGTDLVNTWDLRSRSLRQSELQDVAQAARIADALTEIDFIGSYALPYDVPRNMGYVDSFKAQLENSVKPIFFLLLLDMKISKSSMKWRKLSTVEQTVLNSVQPLFIMLNRLPRWPIHREVFKNCFTVQTTISR